MVSCLMGDSTALASAIVRCCPIFVELIFKPEVLYEFLRFFFPCTNQLIDGCLKLGHSLLTVSFPFFL